MVRAIKKQELAFLIFLNWEFPEQCFLGYFWWSNGNFHKKSTGRPLLEETLQPEIPPQPSACVRSVPGELWSRALLDIPPRDARPRSSNLLDYQTQNDFTDWNSVENPAVLHTIRQIVSPENNNCFIKNCFTTCVWLAIATDGHWKSCMKRIRKTEFRLGRYYPRFGRLIVFKCYVSSCSGRSGCSLDRHSLRKLNDCMIACGPRETTGV